jgi:hypothetical protein
MKRIQLVLAALAIVVTALAAFAGPVMAQVVYENTDNFSNQEYAEFGPGGYASYYDGCWAWDPYWGWYYWCDDDDYYPYYEDDGRYYTSPYTYYEGDPSGPGPWSFYYVY